MSKYLSATRTALWATFAFCILANFRYICGMSKCLSAARTALWATFAFCILANLY